VIVNVLLFSILFLLYKFISGRIMDILPEVNS